MLINYCNALRMTLWTTTFLLCFMFFYLLGYKASRTGDACTVTLSHRYYDTQYLGRYDVSSGLLTCKVEMTDKGKGSQ